MSDYEFPTKRAAVDAEARLRVIHGYPRVGRNAAMGRPEPNKQQTVAWAEPVLRESKWVIPESPVLRDDPAKQADFDRDHPHAIVSRSAIVKVRSPTG